MDRQIVYDQALPQSTDMLSTNKNMLVALGFASRAAFGPNTEVNGLACTPTSPTPDLFVNIAPGSIYSMIQVDGSAYGDLGVDTNSIVKQGILYSAVRLQITPPTVVGYSQVYLVQAQYGDLDGGSVVLPYLNAANWSQPFSGPANSGQSQFSLRQGICNISLVAGIAMPTGQQINPPASFGCTGLYAVTVTNGQTQIVAGNIATLTTAPFFPSLPEVPPGVQQNKWTYAIDTGSVNNVVATVWPIPAALVPGLVAVVKIAFTNTAASTLNLNGLGAAAIHRATGAVLSSGDMTVGQVLYFMYDGSAFQILNFTGATSGTVTNNFNSYAIPYGPDTGPANAMACVFSPAVASLTAGLIVLVKALNTNTASTTLTPSGLATITIKENGLNLLPTAIVAGQLVLLCYDGTFFQKINARNQYFSFDAAAPPASDLTLQVGDQLNITFTNVTALPLHVAAVPGVYDIEFVATASNSIDLDNYFRPNNTTYPGSQFKTWVAMNSDSTTGSPPYVYKYPVAQTWAGQQSTWNIQSFNDDMFDDMSTSPDPINQRGPFMMKYLISTFTNAKQIRFFGGCFGGPSVGYMRWSDTSTPWTSLGTWIVMQNGASAGAANVSGVAIVKRLA